MTSESLGCCFCHWTALLYFDTQLEIPQIVSRHEVKTDPKGNSSDTTALFQMLDDKICVWSIVLSLSLDWVYPFPLFPMINEVVAVSPNILDTRWFSGWTMIFSTTLRGDIGVVDDGPFFRPEWIHVSMFHNLQMKNVWGFPYMPQPAMKSPKFAQTLKHPGKKGLSTASIS